MQKITSALSGLLMTALCASSVWAANVYTQPWNEKAEWDLSQATPSIKVFDNFTLDANRRITDLHWTGFSDAAAQPIGPFLIQMWNDNSGAPDTSASIYSASVAAVQTALPPVDAFSFYNYDIDVLPTAFSATGGVTYWLSIQAPTVFVSGAGGSWGWARSDTGNDVIYSLEGGALTRLAGYDMAFRLTDTTPVSVPEPASLALVGLALVGLYAAGRKKMV